jgi:hypothetical protein
MYTRHRLLEGRSFFAGLAIAGPREIIGEPTSTRRGRWFATVENMRSEAGRA